MRRILSLHRKILIKRTEIFFRRSNEQLDDLFIVIAKEIASSVKRINDTPDNEDDQGLRDAVNEDEGDHIENLLGLAFVSAQTFITAVTNRLNRLSDELEQNDWRRLSFVPNAKYRDALMKCARPMRNASQHTEIEVIDAVANYWKHQEEWQTYREPQEGYTVWDEKKMSSGQQKTCQKVMSIKMSPGKGNLWTAFVELSRGSCYFKKLTRGILNFGNLSPLREKLRNWADRLQKKAQSEIRRKPNLKSQV